MKVWKFERPRWDASVTLDWSRWMVGILYWHETWEKQGERISKNVFQALHALETITDFYVEVGLGPLHFALSWETRRS